MDSPPTFRRSGTAQGTQRDSAA